MHTPFPAPPVVLSFAASDPTGGAGTQADILTLAALGVHPASVLTGITAQDTRGVEAFWPLDPEWINEQARVLLEDIPVAAFKVGVLGSVTNVAVVAEIVSDYPDIPLVLDPVLSSGRGDSFADEDLIDALRELLLPQVTLVTPNSPELRRLVRHDEDDDGPALLADCALRLLDWGAAHVLVTGTHESAPQVVNTLYGPIGLIRADAWERLPGSYHGSGCTLASAIAAHLALGLPISEAVFAAQDFTWQALSRAYCAGMGQFLPQRLFRRDA